ncbi:hypothetical protein VPH35_063091 [Triticum aestivum]
MGGGVTAARRQGSSPASGGKTAGARRSPSEGVLILHPRHTTYGAPAGPRRHCCARRGHLHARRTRPRYPSVSSDEQHKPLWRPSIRAAIHIAGLEKEKSVSNKVIQFDFIPAQNNCFTRNTKNREEKESSTGKNPIHIPDYFSEEIKYKRSK